jgi:hypothetical protein
MLKRREVLAVGVVVGRDEPHRVHGLGGPDEVRGQQVTDVGWVEGTANECDVHGPLHA